MSRTISGMETGRSCATAQSLIGSVEAGDDWEGSPGGVGGVRKPECKSCRPDGSSSSSKSTVNENHHQKY